jgi:hypothetical protein
MGASLCVRRRHLDVVDGATTLRAIHHPTASPGAVVSDAALIALVVGAVATVLLVAFVLVVQIGRIRALYEQATSAFGRLEAATEELRTQQTVLDGELAALGDAMEALRASRAADGRGDAARRDAARRDAARGDGTRGDAR